MKRTIFHAVSLSAVISIGVVSIGCSSSSNNGGSTGGTTKTGGSTVTGGSATGGSVATGGSSSTGGSVKTGGSTATGGASVTGGSSATGGAAATGGTAATGGKTATGGTAMTGGATGTGGSVTMDAGSVTDGATNTGDSPAPDGSVPTQPGTTYTFDEVATGSLPEGWKAMSAFTSGSAPIADLAPAAVKFEVVADTTAGAKAGNRILKLSTHLDSVYDNGHHCWTDAVKFLDGTISADVMAEDAVKGHVGFSFRIKDHKNFYGIRYSFIEGGISLFTVKNGKISNAGIKTTTVTPIEAALKGAKKWVNMKLVVTGGTIKVFLDNVERVNYVDSAPITEAGGVGGFSRGFEAIVSWDNFTVSSAP